MAPRTTKHASDKDDTPEAEEPEADAAEAPAPEAVDAPSPVADEADRIPVARVDTFGMNDLWGYYALDVYGRTLASSEAIYGTPEDARQAAPTEV